MAEIKANVKMLKSLSAGNAHSFATITRQYEGVENDETETLVDNKKNTIEVVLKSHSYASRFEFPNIGNAAILYVDEDSNRVYRWDSGSSTYCCIGSDYSEIKIINGGNANG